MSGQIFLQCDALSKSYGGVDALKSASLAIRENEVVGLVGDNGAGKSTLINILSGKQQADAGTIRIGGQAVRIRKPADARALGIETIYQDNSTVPTMSVARNLFVGREPLAWSILGLGPLDSSRMAADAAAALAEVGLHLRSPDALVGELSGGQRQGVAIARAMYFRSKMIILDEPTNHLSVKETDKVIAFVQTLRGQGKCGIFISHNLHHVFESCHRVVGMARGEIVLDKPVDATSIEEIHDIL
ncbi:ATP-binding cassette domain-containing protein [Tropicimonas sp.]|uniref:ATP-binding cassette domain-containing protein n=1 Tax=Tropicimonas sp. TaxID=2067044 RepID=UPI003A8B12AD